MVKLNIIEINNLNFYFGNNQIFSSLNLNLPSNCFVFLTGSNSSGKTTFLKVISGYYYSNNVKILGMDLNRYTLIKFTN